MPDPTTTASQVANARSRVDSLREEIAAERAAQAATLSEQEDALRLERLQNEEAALVAELDALRARNKPAQAEALAEAPVVEKPKKDSDDANPGGDK